jgi:hypothetical protein
MRTHVGALMDAHTPTTANTATTPPIAMRARRFRKQAMHLAITTRTF